jgi:hypothetical protein
MNKERRAAIAKIIEAVKELDGLRSDISAMIDDVMGEEQNAFDALPESFQEGERGQAMQEALDGLQQALEAVDGWDAEDVTCCLESAAA